MAKPLDVRACYVSIVYLIPAIQIGNQWRVLDYIETIKSKAVRVEGMCIQNLIVRISVSILTQYGDSNCLCQTGVVSEIAS